MMAQAAANALAVWNQVIASAPSVEYMQTAMMVSPHPLMGSPLTALGKARC
jgi:hypothetical protein